MDQALKAYQDAEVAAKKAKIEAENALRNKAAHEDVANKATSNSKAEDAQAAQMRAAADKEKADLAAAEKAYQDAVAGKTAVEAKIEAMKAKQAELANKIKTLWRPRSKQ